MIRVKKIPLTQIRVGMKSAHNVYSELGTLLVQKDTILDFRHLKKLKSLGLQAIDIYVEEGKIELANLHNIGYIPVMEEVKNFLNLAKKEEKINFSLLTNIVEGIKQIHNNRDIVLCLNENFRSEFYIYSHSLNVALLAMLLGRWLKFADRKITQLVYAGLLHDIGKLQVDPGILNKPGKLTQVEFEAVKKHTIYGLQMVETLKFLSPEIKDAILFHHEREDGSGYPHGVKGDQIPRMAKILAVADIYDAMTSNRVYSTEKPPFHVLKMMEDQSYGRLNLEITRTLLSNIANYYVGQRVILSNGEKGEIVFINPTRISRPIIKTQAGFVDLSMESSIQIERMTSGLGKYDNLNDEFSEIKDDQISS